METESKVLKDKDIREPLFYFLEEYFGKVRIFEEKITGRARADLVMVTPGKLYGIEIKSDADSYVRLKRQVEYYDKYYDRNVVVVGSTHAHHVSEHVPDYWGIISVEIIDEKVDFYVIREAADNPNVLAENKIKLLWRPELNHLLEINVLPAYKSMSKPFVQGRILALVPEDVLWNQVTDELFERDYEKMIEEINAFRKSKGKRRRAKPRKSKYYKKTE